MDNKKDHSYGVVPVFKGENRWEFLLIHQISHRGDKFWVFPKGHPDSGESEVETAKRELLEETGISEVDIKDEKTFSVNYQFIDQGITVDKAVTYFIGFVKDKFTKISQPQEIIEIRWCNEREARELLAHQNSRDVLDSVTDFLTKNHE
jgi:8-oxo-dGTP pyrophosphatase MutT (NUDIX family)